MLQHLRDKAQGWITWVIIGAVAVTFVLFGTGSIFSDTSSKKIVAKVEGEKITTYDLEGVYQRFLKQSGNQSLQNIDPSTIKIELLQSLIEQAVLLSTAKKLGMGIGSDRITSVLSSVPFLLDEQGRFSPEAYTRFLSNSNYSDADFRQLLKDSLLREQLQQGISQSAFTVFSDVQELSRYNLQKRSFRYTLVEKQKFAKNVDIKDEEIKKFYDSHLKDFLTEEEVALEYIHLSKQDLINKYQPTDEELQHFYQENIALFTEPQALHVAHILISAPKSADDATKAKAKAKILEIQAKSKAGEQFSDLAKKFSDDKGSSEQGGVLEWFTKGEMVPEFEKVAFELNQNGQISEIVQTDFGYHLIQFLGKKSEAVRPFAEIKSEVAEKLKEQWAEEKLVSLADQLAGVAYDSPDSLQPASDKLNLPIQKTELFSNVQGPKETLLQNQAVLEAAFSPHQKEDKNNSDLIKVDDQNYLVLRVTRHEVPKQKSFDAVKNEIKQFLTTQRLEELTKLNADKIVETIKKAPQTDMASILGQYSWTEKNDLLHSTQGMDPDILNTAFSISRPADDKARAIKAAKIENGDYAVVWLIKVEDGNADTLTAQEKETYQKALTKHMSELEFALYATDLFKKAKIEKHL